MNEQDLSPEAQERLRELTPSTYCDDWTSNYHAMLKKLAARNTSDVTEWEIKGKGAEVLEKSREDYRVAVELKDYAIPQLELFRLLELDGSPESLPIPFDDFLDKMMPITGKEVRRERFMRFLIAKAEGDVDEQMELHPHTDTLRDDHVKQMAAMLFAHFDEDGIHGPTRNFYGPWFRDWWKRNEGNPLGNHNDSKKMAVADRRKKLIALLPSRPNIPGITKEKWRDLAMKNGLFSSPRTFNTDVKTLVDSKAVRVQDSDGNFRQLPK